MSSPSAPLGDVLTRTLTYPVTGAMSGSVEDVAADLDIGAGPEGVLRTHRSGSS